MNRRWKRGIFRRGAVALLGMALAFGYSGNPALGKMVCRAAEYSYTVTFYPGNHGSFQGTEAVTVDNSASGSEYEISADSSAIRISGLSAGDVVGLDAAMEGAVEMEEGSRYYVKGIRVSGRDNSTVDASAFRVEEDRDYVVAYGIRGDLTSYVVNYRDEAGNALAESRTYYGNVGDKPRMAYIYIEGYQPQAYNLTKTLSKNTAENVFTFIYTKIPAGQTGGGTGGGTGTGGGQTGGGTGQGTGTGGQTGGGTVPTVPAGTTPGQTGNVPNPDGGQGGDAQNPDYGQGGNNPDEGQGGGTQNPDDGQGGTQNPDESQGGGTQNEGNDGPREEQDLDDQETPLGNYGGENDGKEGPAGFHFPIWASIVIAVAGAAAVIAAVCMVFVTKKKERAKHQGKSEN